MIVYMWMMKETGHDGETEGVKEPLTKWEGGREEQAREKQLCGRADPCASQHERIGQEIGRASGEILP